MDKYHLIRDKIINEVMHDKVRVAPIDDKMKESRLRWYGDMIRRNSNTPVRRSERIVSSDARGGRRRGRPRRNSDEVIIQNMTHLQLT